MPDPISESLVRLALREDIGTGDATSALIDWRAAGEAFLVAKSDLILFGEEAVHEVFRQVDPRVEVQFEVQDGESAAPRTVIAVLTGPARSLLTGERTALNLLQHLSGIATSARACADAVAETPVRIVDTRKVMPGIRTWAKAAVRAGGCYNHRFGLFDGILIKDNHIAQAGGIHDAVARVRGTSHHLLKIEVEVTTLEGLSEAIDAGADVVMLDNMALGKMSEAVQQAGGRVLVEASGNMTLDRLPAVAETGIDLISIGALTHSVLAADISMRWHT